MREKLATGIIGLALVDSVAAGTPLMAILVEASVARAPADRAERLRAVLALPGFPRAARLLTLVWGIGLLADVAISAAMIFLLPVSACLVAGPLFGYAVTGALSLWTWRYAKRNGLNGGNGARVIACALTVRRTRDDAPRPLNLERPLRLLGLGRLLCDVGIVVMIGTGRPGRGVLARHAASPGAV